MKKKIYIIAAAAVLAAAVTACNSKSKPQSEPFTSGESSELEEEKEEEEKEESQEGNESQEKEEGTDKEEQKEETKEETGNETDSLMWINAAYAGITRVNGGDISLIGGFEKNSANTAYIKTILESSWDVTDKKTAEETLEWLLSEGHRSSFQAEMEQLKAEGYFDGGKEERKAALAELGYTEALTACYESLMNIYEKNGEHAIDAWDYCRALQLLGWYYIADYYTREEAVSQSLEIAKKLQKTYSSWDELIESYMTGYNYWQEEDPKAPDSETAKRQKVFDELKSGRDNPYTIDWDLKL